jgi:ubiquinone/menaquinone biosynthesis C-methylase UbiE
MATWPIVLIAAAAVTVAVSVWWRVRPSACPYGARIFVSVPHPLITRGRLRRILEPAPGERILEIGPGTGYYSLDVARAVGPNGRLAIFDLQQEMLDHTMRKAERAGVANIEPTQGDATRLAYGDGEFDAAYLVTVLGEIPDQDAALREIRRVLKPGGRLVNGEIFIDPHLVTLRSLQSRAPDLGFRYDRKVGSPLGYFGRFEAA